MRRPWGEQGGRSSLKLGSVVSCSLRLPSTSIRYTCRPRSAARYPSSSCLKCSASITMGFGADPASLCLMVKARRLPSGDQAYSPMSPLTLVSGDIGEYAWSPDGKRLAFTMRQSDAGSAPKPIVIDALHFKQDEDGYLAADRGRHVYLIDVEGKRSEQLTTDPSFNEDLPAWSPDGRRIAFIRTHEQGADQDGREDIALAEPVAGAVPRTIVRPFAPNTQKLAWSPDGTLIAYLQGLEPKFNAYMQDRLAVVPAGGGAPRPLSDKLDRAVMSFAFADSASIMVSVEDDGRIYPARGDLRGGAITREAAAGSFAVSALASAAGHTALLESNDGALAEVYALEAGQLRKLTAHNDALLSELRFGAG